MFGLRPNFTEAGFKNELLLQVLRLTMVYHYATIKTLIWKHGLTFVPIVVKDTCAEQI